MLILVLSPLYRLEKRWSNLCFYIQPIRISFSLFLQSHYQKKKGRDHKQAIAHPTPNFLPTGGTSSIPIYPYNNHTSVNQPYQHLNHPKRQKRTQLPPIINGSVGKIGSLFSWWVKVPLHLVRGGHLFHQPFPRGWDLDSLGPWAPVP